VVIGHRINRHVTGTIHATPLHRTVVIGCRINWHVNGTVHATPLHRTVVIGRRIDRHVSGTIHATPLHRTVVIGRRINWHVNGTVHATPLHRTVVIGCRINRHVSGRVDGCAVHAVMVGADIIRPVNGTVADHRVDGEAVHPTLRQMVGHHVSRYVNGTAHATPLRQFANHFLAGACSSGGLFSAPGNGAGAGFSSTGSPLASITFRPLK